jgi:hypothetical protein
MLCGAAVSRRSCYAAVSPPYPAFISHTEANVAALQALLTVFTTPSTMEDHVAACSCVQDPTRRSRGCCWAGANWGALGQDTWRGDMANQAAAAYALPFQSLSYLLEFTGDMGGHRDSGDSAHPAARQRHKL